jgi:hypothetical protein
MEGQPRGVCARYQLPGWMRSRRRGRWRHGPALGVSAKGGDRLDNGNACRFRVTAKPPADLGPAGIVDGAGAQQHLALGAQSLAPAAQTAEDIELDRHDRIAAAGDIDPRLEPAARDTAAPFYIAPVADGRRLVGRSDQAVGEQPVQPALDAPAWPEGQAVYLRRLDVVAAA